MVCVFGIWEILSSEAQEREGCRQCGCCEEIKNEAGQCEVRLNSEVGKNLTLKGFYFSGGYTAQ
jgi:hypothetical protein